MFQKAVSKWTKPWHHTIVCTWHTVHYRTHIPYPQKVRYMYKHSTTNITQWNPECFWDSIRRFYPFIWHIFQWSLQELCPCETNHYSHGYSELSAPVCQRKANKLKNIYYNIKILQNVVKKTKLQYLVVNIEPLWMVVHFVGLYCYSRHETKRLEIIQ